MKDIKLIFVYYTKLYYELLANYHVIAYTHITIIFVNAEAVLMILLQYNHNMKNYTFTSYVVKYAPVAVMYPTSLGYIFVLYGIFVFLPYCGVRVSTIPEAC